MYQPGMDRQLAQVYYNDMLQEAAAERAQRRQAAGPVKPVARKLVLALAAAAPLAALIVWMSVAH